MSFSTGILIGLIAGTGLFFGEPTVHLDFIADGFIKLLRMTVLPYIVVSLVLSLGSLKKQQAKQLVIYGRRPYPVTALCRLSECSLTAGVFTSYGTDLTSRENRQPPFLFWVLIDWSLILISARVHLAGRNDRKPALPHNYPCSGTH
jgi:L-cystine uptake protein TcyP (sodium:dicarboxylate symporter family)